MFICNKVYNELQNTGNTGKLLSRDGTQKKVDKYIKPHRLYCTALSFNSKRPVSQKTVVLFHIIISHASIDSVLQIA